MSSTTTTDEKLVTTKLARATLKLIRIIAAITGKRQYQVVDDLVKKEYEEQMSIMSWY